IAARNWHRAAGWHWHRAPKYAHRPSRRRGRPRETLGERHDRRPGHHFAGHHAAAGARDHDQIPHLRFAGYARIAAYRHSYESRPAVREESRAARKFGNDEGESGHRARGHHARRGRAYPAKASHRETSRRGPRLQPKGFDHRKGHPEKTRVSALL